MSLHTFTLFPAPERRPELRVYNDTPDPGMDSKCKVVEADCRLRTERVSSGILSSHYWRVQEDAGADGVAAEAEDVQKRKIG